MLENIEDPELNWLFVLLPEPFHVLGDLDLRLLVDQLGV